MNDDTGIPPRPAEPAAPQPVQVDTRRIILIGTAIWLVAFIVLLPFWGWLGRHDHRVWLWTCLAGWVLGLLGLILVRKHRGEGRTI